MAQTHEWMFYEVMWRLYDRRQPYPFPWWIQQYFRHWNDHYDSGLFDSKEAAFSSNAYFRYWNMIGVKDHRQETLIGQAGEVEPVYDKYALSFFLYDPAARQLYLPQSPYGQEGQESLEQRLQRGYLPVVETVFRAPGGFTTTASSFATVFGDAHKSVVVVDYELQKTGESPL